MKLSNVLLDAAALRFAQEQFEQSEAPELIAALEATGVVPRERLEKTVSLYGNFIGMCAQGESVVLDCTEIRAVWGFHCHQVDYRRFCAAMRFSTAFPGPSRHSPGARLFTAEYERRFGETFPLSVDRR